MWLLRDDVARHLAQAMRSGLSVSAEKRQEFIAQRTTAEGAAEPRSFKSAGDVAEIRIEGVLTPKPDILAFLFGGGNTSYEDLNAAFSRAAVDPAIKRVQLHVNSPGGHMDGLYELLATIEAFTKPIEVLAAEACSAAYMVAAVAGPIKATSPAAKFGSVGVVGKVLLDNEIVEIANTESPKKRPDVTTDEGKAVVREYIDTVFDLFVDAIAHGRQTTRADVVENYGRGATLLAGEAKRLGMIDKIATSPLRALPKSRVAAEETMDLNSLKTNHPELYQAVLLEGKNSATAAPPAAVPSNSNTAPGGGAVVDKQMDLKTLKVQHPEVYEAAVRDGVTSERDRVNAHLTAGEMSGDLKTAMESIRSGDSMTQTLSTKYLMAAANRSDRSARQAETDAAGKAVASANTSATAEDRSEQVADLVEQMLGTKKKVG